MSSIGKRIAIIGAGPIGLEAALHGALAGYDVQVFERKRVAQNIKEWGHVRLFSPFSMNSSERGRKAVAAADARAPLPDVNECHTGWEYAENYLLPLSRVPELKDRVHEATEVLAIGRTHLWKKDFIGSPRRFKDPFQLLVLAANGIEKTFAADFVFDCSGSYPNHRWLGAGGIPCPGEHECAARINYLLPDLLGTERASFAGKKTLVVGCGYSAATAIAQLAELAAEEPRTGIMWVTRGDTSPPYSRIENDPLEGRDRLAAWVNGLAAANRGPVHFMPGRVIRGIDFRVDRGKFLVVLERLHSRAHADSSGQTTEQLAVDRVIANVGYGPDRALCEELQIHECYATQGPMRLAASLMGETSSDRLQQKHPGAEDLRNPEPGFYILGAKSYGRDSRFLIQTGLRQICDVFSLIEQDAAAAGCGKDSEEDVHRKPS